MSLEPFKVISIIVDFLEGNALVCFRVMQTVKSHLNLKYSQKPMRLLSEFAEQAVLPFPYRGFFLGSEAGGGAGFQSWSQIC